MTNNAVSLTAFPSLYPLPEVILNNVVHVTFMSIYVVQCIHTALFLIHDVFAFSSMGFVVVIAGGAEGILVQEPSLERVFIHSVAKLCTNVSTFSLFCLIILKHFLQSGYYGKTFIVNTFLILL